MQSKASSKHIEPHHVFIIFLLLLTFVAVVVVLVYGYMTYSNTKYVHDKVKKIDDKVQMIQNKLSNLDVQKKIMAELCTICSQDLLSKTEQCKELVKKCEPAYRRM